MKEKIEQLAKGIFEYTMPSIFLSDESLELSVEVSKTFKGSFSLKTWENTNIKGVVYSSHQAVHIINDNFIGLENVIEYEVNTAAYLPGDMIKGVITVVSNHGEIEIPFVINIELPHCVTTIGKIKDLYQFANLAKQDWHEALMLFKKDDFERVFLNNDDKARLLYHSLLKGRTSSMALEEFLITIRKKERINLSIDKLKETYTLVEESIMDKVTITKDNWGFAEIRVSTDVPFIELDHKMIWTDNFLGNSFTLEYIMNPTRMRDGNNFGKIYIKTVHQTMEIEISCRCHKNHIEKNVEHIRKRIHEQLFVTNYLKLRIGQIDVNEYIEKVESILHTLSVMEESDYAYELIRTHLYIISGNHENAKLMLDQFKEIKEELKQKSMDSYCGYVYLNALFYKEDHVINEAVLEINQVYVSTSNNFRTLWYLLYLDKKYDVNKTNKLAELRKQFHLGSNSPVLYYEAYNVLKEEPNLLHELRDFEIQVMNWVIKNSYLTPDLLEQYTYLASRTKGFHKVIYNCLVSIYEEEQSKEVLAAICSMLIKGHKTATKYFYWFKLGVEAQLRITELYEYYMYTIDEKKEMPLEQQILFYYLYNSTLSDKKKAYLYSRIIQNKEKDANIYHTYAKNIEQFAMKQIQLHNISENLSIIYDDILKQEMIDEEVACHLSEIMFQVEICCTNKNIKGVLVIHKEIEEEMYVPFTDGRAYAPVYTNDAIIFLVDIFENRFVTTIDYTMNPLMHSGKYKNRCYLLNPSQSILILPILEDMLYNQKSDHEMIEIKKNALKISNLREDYKKSYIKSLIYYYNDRLDSELLLSYLDDMDLNGFHKSDRSKLIEFFIDHKMFKRAYDIMKDYGYDEIKKERLIPFCIYYINQMNGEKDELLVRMCFELMRANCLVETIIQYLVKHFFKTTKEMLEVYVEAKELRIDLHDLAERLLVQMLFSDSNIEKSYEVFKELYHTKKERRLARAYLNYISYQTIMHDQSMSYDIMSIMKNEITYEENRLYLITILKVLSEEEILVDEDIQFVDYQINQLIEEGLILPFFLKFKDKVELPELVLHSYYIEYKAEPMKKILLHYRISSSLTEEEKYEIVQMKNVYEGLFVHQFLLFYGETLEYYIAEVSEKGDKITETIRVTLDNKIEQEDEKESKYNQINFMLMTKELKDDETLYQLIEHYKKKELAASYLFTIL